MMTPGPDHPITIEPAPRRWRAKFAGHVIADTARALILREAGHPPRVYFPRADVSMDYMSRTDARTHCPYKGDASYFTVLMDGQFAESAVWTYEAPYPAVDLIEGLLSFYPDRIEVYEVNEAQLNAHQRGAPTIPSARSFVSSVDDVVQHTDSGSGASQRDHWAATAREPASALR